ncbi:MAG TPA: hypothetical protein VKB96_04595 [Gammaproteobacteria bacterium]|jgi:hypothetical protein|nr:hypothetical protein [Gammaproteobacteria bacterium]
MPKKKSLPDVHATGDKIEKELKSRYPAAYRAFQRPGKPIVSRQAVIELAQRHKFPDDFELAAPLDDVLQRYFYIYARERVEGKSAQQKKYLREVKGRAAQLRECLDKMSSDMQCEIHEHWNDIYPRADNEPPSKYGWRRRMLDDARRLTAAAQQALRAKPTDTRLDKAFCTLMDQLLGLFESATRTRVTGLTRDPDDDVSYSDPPVKFVEDCLRLAGIRKSNSAVGQALAEAIKRKRTGT